jgi:hypothetical protein
MTALALVTEPLKIPIQVQQDVLARIDRGGLFICEAELRLQLRWSEHNNGPLLPLLGELEHRGLIESAMHFRLTEQGRAHLPAGYVPIWRYGTGIPWKVRAESGPQVGRPQYRDIVRADPDLTLRPVP